MACRRLRLGSPRPPAGTCNAQERPQQAPAGGHTGAARISPDPLNPLDLSGQSPALAPYSSPPWRPQGRPQVWLRQIVLEAGKEQVVLPCAVDAQVLAGKSLAPEPGPLQEPDRGHVGRDAG